MPNPCQDKQEAVTNRAKELVQKLQQDSAALAAQVQDEAKDIDPDLDTNGPAVWVGINIDVSWKTRKFAMDLPEVTLIDQKFALDLPQVTMRDQRISWDMPVTVMKTVKVGEYPEVTCSGFPPSCTVTWSPIYADVPVVESRRQEIVIGLPEFSMGRSEFVIGVPEVTMKRVDFSMDLPEFTVKEVNVEARKAEEKGKALNESAMQRSDALKQSFKENAKATLGSDVAVMFDCYLKDVSDRKNEAMQQFNQGIAMMEGSITGLLAQKVPEENPSLVQLRSNLAALIQKREEFGDTIRAQLEKLYESQKSFIDKLLAN